jgi:Domain of unknown function (DUF4203)
VNDYAQVAQINALLVIIAGLLICFWGYRILKVSLGIIGFVGGAFGGWELGLAWANNSGGITLACALAGGIIGMVLCLLFYFLGVFLLGAAAGAVVAAACANGISHPVQPLILLVLPIAFGVIALLAQKFMIVVSTAFSGAYLITAGIWPFVVHGQDAAPIWLYPAHHASPGNMGYAALALWVVLALLGMATQLRAGRRKVEVVEVQKK